jgi:hypothetical protein
MNPKERKKTIEQVASKYFMLINHLDERARRRWAATEAQALGWGGISLVAEATGLSDRTIRSGLEEIATGEEHQLEITRQRRKGAGRKRIEQTQPELLKALENLIEPSVRGDPVSPLRWTCKSTRTISSELSDQGFSVSYAKIHGLLREMGYSMQSNRKTREGSQHPDRNEQFVFISKRVKEAQKRMNPALSVDTKKKEVLGLKRNSGKVLRPKGEPVKVDVHDFPDKKKGKAVPYGVYDIGRNEAGVSVGISHDTAEFAVGAIRRWWNKLGRKRYPNCDGFLITADSGGSNSSRSRLWKVELQGLANALGKSIEVCHFPPGTSKWNKIEHRLFCHITRNWQGVPLETLEIVVNLIGATKTETGLEVHAWVDEKHYEKGKKIDDKTLGECLIKRNKFHGDWNYKILPQAKNR